MIPVQQTRTGSNGNCFEASIASLLGLPIEQVPDLGAYEDNGLWMEKLNEWLAQKGLSYFESRIARNELDDFFIDKDFYHVLIGPTERSKRILHAVVGRKGKMVHDPHPDNIGVLLNEETVRMGVIVFQCI